MPEIGETKREANRTYIWDACEICGECRWVQLVKGKAKNILCRKCSHSGKRHARWAGGRNDNGKGYIRIWLDLGDFFYQMTDLPVISNSFCLMCLSSARVWSIWFCCR